MKVYRVFFHTPFKKEYIDIPAHNKAQAEKRALTLYKTMWIDNIIEKKIKKHLTPQRCV